jgi:uncharacterized protein YbjT (DUF2867 family)
MTTPLSCAVTGAFGYSGSHIASGLLESGHAVRTLTNSPRPKHPLASKLSVYPLCFDEPEKLRQVLRGVEVLFNTYWVRFNHQQWNHDQAVRNTKALFQAAKTAGVRRIVHLSITNPSLDSSLSYFRGKAELEQHLEELGLSFAILRPAVLFGNNDILINNIAWALRRFPFFPVFADGNYRVRSIHVEDLANLAASAGASQTDVCQNAVGPESYRYADLVRLIGSAIGCPRRMIRTPPSLAFLAARCIGAYQRDVFLTRDEITGLMQDLLHVDGPATGEVKLSQWCRDNASTLGRKYACELARRKTSR